VPSFVTAAAAELQRSAPEETKMDDYLDWLKVGGSIAGIAALLWRILDEFGTYLHIAVSNTPAEGNTIAITSVENKGNRGKRIDNAFLLIGPENESPIDTANAIGIAQKIQTTNELEMLKAHSPKYESERAVIPLPFYYSENLKIGDETLTYAAPILHSPLRPGTAYAIRFFIFAKGRLHRSTESTFFTP
jgi:hypothetical protein